jgi:hypothetical protein
MITDDYVLPVLVGLLDFFSSVVILDNTTVLVQRDQCTELQRIAAQKGVEETPLLSEEGGRIARTARQQTKADNSSESEEQTRFLVCHKLSKRRQSRQSQSRLSHPDVAP